MKFYYDPILGLQIQFSDYTNFKRKTRRQRRKMKNKWGNTTLN